MKAALSLLVMLCIAVSGCTSVESNKDSKNISTELSSIVDGDTVEIMYEGSEEDVRLIGVDTPEVHVENDPSEFKGIPDNSSGRTCLRDWGENASKLAKQTLEGKQVKVEVGMENGEIERGDYDRILGEIWYRNSSFNRRLVRDGYARSYSSNGPFTREEVEAIRKKRGLWDCIG